MIESFEEKNFHAKSLRTIEQANAILTEYDGQGYTLSLRQLYYQFVARGLIENTERSYKNLGNLITDARLNGLMDWSAIEDRGRSLEKPYVKDNLSAILGALKWHYAANFWSKQPYYIEVWVEKDALSSVIERACEPFKIPSLACKGYMSASEQYDAAKRFEEAHSYGKECLLIHLGDHDPSGIDMTRDNSARLNLMSYDAVTVRRIALNRDQIDRYDPPPNPAKITDSRFEEYRIDHGDLSWELDALEPSVIEKLIQDEINPLIDRDAWAKSKAEENEKRKLLEGVSTYWIEIEDVIRANWREADDETGDDDDEEKDDDDV